MEYNTVRVSQFEGSDVYKHGESGLPAQDILGDGEYVRYDVDGRRVDVYLNPPKVEIIKQDSGKLLDTYIPTETRKEFEVNRGLLSELLSFVSWESDDSLTVKFEK